VWKWKTQYRRRWPEKLKMHFFREWTPHTTEDKRCKMQLKQM